jgi:hypothetical protein
VIEVFKANHSEQTSGSYFLKTKGGIFEATTGITLKCGGSHVVIDPSGVTVKGPLVTVDGAQVKIASGPGSPPTVGVKRSAAQPAAPESALDADIADPGKVAKAKVGRAHPLEKIPFSRAAVTHTAIPQEGYSAQNQDEEEPPPELEFAFCLSDTPDPAGHVLAHVPWMVTTGRKPDGMDLVPPELVLAKGETDANGEIQFDGEQKKAITEAYSKRPEALWLLYPGSCVRIEATTESLDWSDEEKLHHALLAADFCSELPRSGSDNAAELTRVAQDAYELSDAEELYSKLPDK